MRQDGKKWGQVLLGCGVSALFVALLVSVVDLGQLLSALGGADFRLVPLAIGLYFLGAFVRSVRWRLLLPGESLPVGTLFRALIVGFTVNNLLPARLGEVARAFLLARWCSVAYGVTFASLVVERVLDGLALVAILLAALVFVPSAPEYLYAIGVAFGWIFLAGAVVLGLVAYRANALLVLARAVGRFLPARGAALVERLAGGFADGLSLVRGWGLLARLAVLSLVGWTCELALFYVLMFGFPLPASVPLAFLTGTAANFATLVPSSPGYVGTFDSVLVKVLVDVAAVDAETAVAYALVVHATLFVPVVLVGCAILWLSNISFGQVMRARVPASAVVPDGAGA